MNALGLVACLPLFPISGREPRASRREWPPAARTPRRGRLTFVCLCHPVSGVERWWPHSANFASTRLTNGLPLAPYIRQARRPACRNYNMTTPIVHGAIRVAKSRTQDDLESSEKHLAIQDRTRARTRGHLLR